MNKKSRKRQLQRQRAKQRREQPTSTLTQAHRDHRFFKAINALSLALCEVEKLTHLPEHEIDLEDLDTFIDDIKSLRDDVKDVWKNPTKEG